MKILILSGSPIMGGGELVARRLAVELARAGCRITYVSVFPEKITEFGLVHYIIDTAPMHRWILQNLRFFSYPFAYKMNTRFALKAIGKILQKERPDVINIHNIKQAFLSPEIVGFCAERAPVVWTLHDMSSFTGRCVHAFSCNKFIDGCDETCPNLHIPLIIPRSYTRKRWLHSKKILDTHPSIVAVCPSKWLAGLARKSLWANHRIEIIPNGIDPQLFISMDKKKARQKLGLPQGIILILFAAADLNSPSKGGNILQESLKKIHNKNIGLVTIGRNSEILQKYFKIPIFNLGFISPNDTPLVYSSVDLVVHPSKAESFGMVVIEANACGVPVLAFSNSALNEIIKDGVNGWLVKENTGEALVDKLNIVLQDIPDNLLSQSSRHFTEEHYSLERQAESYRRLFTNLITN